MKKDKKEFVFFLLSLVFTVFFCVSFGIFSYHILKLNILPLKFLIGGFLLVFVLFCLFLYLLFKRKNRIIKVLVFLFLLLFSGAFYLGGDYLKNTYLFFNNTNQEYDTLTFSVLALKENGFSQLEEIENKMVGYMSDDYKEEIHNSLQNKIQYQEVLKEEFGSVVDALFEKEVDAIVLESSYLAILKEEIENLETSTKVLYTFEVKEKTHIENEETRKNTEITLTPFILYISGIDQWGNVVSSRGRSDVNQLAVINPRTHHVLFVNTPRDYYVQLAGTTGLRDKLTHAGIYGIDKSIKTLENFYEIDITHYVRVNFNTVIKVVDVIGGIDIYSDLAYKPRNDSRYINKGWNHFDGKLALAYARERYAYQTGDHHRGANQQQVMTAILEKLTSSTILISKYNSILNALDGTFQTDMSMEEMTSFIKYQLEKMPSWKIESYAVTGSGSMDYTYSMGSKHKLYVMEPNMNSVKVAKQKIYEVLHEA